MPQALRDHPNHKANSHSLEAWVRRGVVDALRATGGNVSRAAQRLGISKTTLYRRLKDFDLDPTDFEIAR